MTKLNKAGGKTFSLRQINVIKMKTYVGLILIFGLIRLNAAAPDPQQKTAGINEGWLKGVISIELTDQGGAGQAIGTGFLVATASNNVALVTAKHVVVHKQTQQVRNNIAYRLPTQLGSELLTDSAISFFSGPWVLATNHDVACRLLAFSPDKQTGTNSYDLSATPIWWFYRKDQLTAGAPVYALGFPMRMRSESKPRAIVRKGIIARCDEDGLIIDASIFPGNSGGPVFYSPEVTFRGGANSVINVPYSQDQKLIGLVSEGINYQDVASSQQTGRARVVFEESTGLTYLVPAEAIVELLNSASFREIETRAMKSGRFP